MRKALPKPICKPALIHLDKRKCGKVRYVDKKLVDLRSVTRSPGGTTVIEVEFGSFLSTEVDAKPFVGGGGSAPSFHFRMSLHSLPGIRQNLLFGRTNSHVILDVLRPGIWHGFTISHSDSGISKVDLGTHAAGHETTWHSVA